jgi:predicted DNA-binding transcriptional regulator AlpA
VSDQLREILDRLAGLEQAVATIGHNGGPPLDESESAPLLTSAEDALLPTSAVAKRYGVSQRTIARWRTRPGLNFPQPVEIACRNYWSVMRLRTFDRARRAARGSP